jgi:hypothetical protein
MKAPSKAKTKPLSRLKNTSKGKIHHVEIHPAKNSDGSLGLITRIHRHPPQQAPGAPYQQPPEPEETIHEDPQDGMDHVGQALGVPQEPDEDDEQQQPAAAAPQRPVKA